MPEVATVDAARTPVDDRIGGLADVHPAGPLAGALGTETIIER
ncbi:MAG: hypothetical protein ACYDEN_05495 [Acidimicrobiales bacterium]